MTECKLKIVWLCEGCGESRCAEVEVAALLCEVADGALSLQQAEDRLRRLAERVWRRYFVGTGGTRCRCGLVYDTSHE
jgi:hypothetical protein